MSTDIPTILKTSISILGLYITSIHCIDLSEEPYIDLNRCIHVDCTPVRMLRDVYRTLVV